MLLRLKVVAILQAEGAQSQACIETLIGFQSTLGEEGFGDPDLDSEWQDCFVEQLCTYVIAAECGHAAVDVSRLVWIVTALRDEAGFLIPLGLEVLVALLERAYKPPKPLPRLAFLAMCSRLDVQGCVTAGDAAQMAIILNALRSKNEPVTNEDAARLMALSTKIARARNHVSWTRLYARTIGQYLLSRAQTDATIERLITLSVGAPVSPAQDENWLVRQIGRAEAANPAERALVDYLRAHQMHAMRPRAVSAA